MFRLISHFLAPLLIIALLTACGSQPRQPDEDTLDRRDDAMEELDRNTRN